MPRVRRPACLLLVLALAAGAVPADAPEAVPTWTAPPVDVDALRAEDALREGMGVPDRVGFPIKADIAPGRFGRWEDGPDGSRTWRAAVRSPGALWLALGFGTFRIPPGASLVVRDPDGRTVRGPYTARDVRPHGQLWPPPVAGDTAIVELTWPKSVAGEEPNVHLGTVSHGYEPWGGIGAPPDDPSTDAGACNIDINCPLGADWQNEKHGVVNLLSGGSGYCTGSLIVTTDRDCRNYVLTANHCVSGASGAASTVFQFNFERPQCDSGIPPTDQTVSGSSLVATYSASDFTLLEMDSDPLESYQAYYNGWSRSPDPASESWCIHHPNNDEKKISYNADPLINGQNWGPDHWRVTEWEQGTTEPGSSGSPLFDPGHRIVGQLHGGTASCSSLTYDEFGKLAVSWDGGGTSGSRLSDWLDPTGTGHVTEDGLAWSDCQVPKPKLLYDDQLVDDAQGNGDGVVDPGERFVLQLDVRNSGTLGATSVAGTLTTTTPLVTLVDDAATYPDIPASAVRRSDPPHYTLETDPAFVCGDPIELTLTMTATEDPGTWTSSFTVPTGTPAVDTLFFDDIEGDVSSWTVETPQGSNPWQVDAGDANSPTRSWFVADIDTVSDSLLVLAEQPALPANTELRFWHRINAENNYDGGVLEYSENGGPWVDAGPLITQGGYTSTISTSYSSPIGGREAWSGDNGGWQEVRVDLSSLAGSDVRLRWRFATDSSVSDVGWRIDDVTLESTSYVCHPLGPLPPGEASDPAGPGAPLTIRKDPGGYLLEWSAPPDGGPPTGYRLYRTVLGTPVDPACEADLGSGTSAVLASLPDDRGLLVVARNDAGEGPYGHASAGTERAPSKAPCP
ncbi:MAG: hypothetical protein D6738_03460 [Acidobacteria bacterium]|nr:MAG: hypothetical protein D6738_03460 [Acidobacteriota bacterium]